MATQKYTMNFANTENSQIKTDLRGLDHADISVACFMLRMKAMSGVIRPLKLTLSRASLLSHFLSGRGCCLGLEMPVSNESMMDSDTTPRVQSF